MNKQKISFNTVLSNNKIELLSYLLVIAISFVLPISTFLTNALFIAAIVLYFLGGDIGAKFNFIINNKIALLFLIFCGLFFIGLFYNSGSLIEGIKIFYKYVDKFFYGALLFPIFKKAKLREYAINIFMIAMLLVLALSYLSHFNLIKFYFTSHSDEVFKSHIETNFLMAFTSYLVMQKIFSQTLRYRWLLIIGLLLLITYIFFLDAGRSGYFVFIGLLVLFLWQKFSWKGLLGAMIASICLAVIAFSCSSTFKARVKEIPHEIISYYPGTITSIGSRMDFVKNSVELIKKHPYFGTGTGSFAYEYQKINSSDLIVDNPHNEFLYIGVQFGILGIVLLLSIFYMQLYESKKLPRHLKELAQALVVSYFIGCFGNSWFKDTTQGHFYVYLSAIIFSALPTNDIWRKGMGRLRNLLNNW